MKELIVRLSQQLMQHNYQLVTAESCTGGGVAAALTELTGSSQWFERGFITYSNEAKQELLGVQLKTLEQCGAVSEETAREMASGALRNSHAQVSLAVTGIAGPSGGSADKPVGMVCFAWKVPNREIESNTQHFLDDRQQIRHQAVQYVLEQLLSKLTP